MVQQLYVLSKLGKTEDAEKLISEITLDQYEKSFLDISC